MDNLFKVSARSRAASLAGAIAGTIRDGQPVSLQAIGAGSVNQAVKAMRFQVDRSGKSFPPAKSAHAREVAVDAPAIEPASSRNGS